MGAMEPIEARNPIAFERCQRLNRVRRCVLENLNTQIALSDAARVACLERCYFSRYFKTKTGILFSQWLTMLRLDRAATLLALSDLSVEEVSRSVGFESVRTFERNFGSGFGTTPREFRRSCRKKCSDRTQRRQQLSRFPQSNV